MPQMDDRNKGGSDKDKGKDKDRQQGNQKSTGSQGVQGQSAGRRPGTQGVEPGAGRIPGKVGQKSGPGSPHRQQSEDDDQDEGK